VAAVLDYLRGMVETGDPVEAERAVLALHAVYARAPSSPADASLYKTEMLKLLERIGLVVVASRRYPGGVAAVAYNRYASTYRFMLVNMPLDLASHSVDTVIPYMGDAPFPAPLGRRRPTVAEQVVAGLLSGTNWHGEPALRRLYTGDAEFRRRWALGVERLAARAAEAYSAGDSETYKAAVNAIRVTYKVLREAGVPRHLLPFHQHVPRTLLYVSAGEPRPAEVLVFAERVRRAGRHTAEQPA